MEKIMVIEDDGAIRDELALILENEGYETVLVTDFEDVTGQVINSAPALVLLDLGLPGRDGMMRRYPKENTDAGHYRHKPGFRSGRVKSLKPWRRRLHYKAL